MPLLPMHHSSHDRSVNTASILRRKAVPLDEQLLMLAAALAFQTKYPDAGFRSLICRHKNDFRESESDPKVTFTCLFIANELQQPLLLTRPGAPVVSRDVSVRACTDGIECQSTCSLKTTSSIRDAVSFSPDVRVISERKKIIR